MEKIQHTQIEAILLSTAAISVMSHTLYTNWLAMTEARARCPEAMPQAFVDEAAGRLEDACKAAHRAMDLIGDIVNGCDAADEHQYTDKAFETMCRALADCDNGNML